MQLRLSEEELKEVERLKEILQEKTASKAIIKALMSFEELRSRNKTLRQTCNEFNYKFNKYRELIKLRKEVDQLFESYQ